MTEEKFPTIEDFSDLLTDLISKGYGELPVQLLVAPDSTIQILARHNGKRDKPALMLEWQVNPNRLPVSIITAERLSGGGMPAITNQ